MTFSYLIVDNGVLGFWGRQLLRAKELVPEALERIVMHTKEAAWMGHDRVLSYWRDNISYQLDERAQAGLLLYYIKCFENGLIHAVPELLFTSS